MKPRGHLFRVVGYKLVFVPEAQVPAHGDAGVEGLDAEVHRTVYIAQVWQLDPTQQNKKKVSGCI
jgi:hypothetical protein